MFKLPRSLEYVYFDYDNVLATRSQKRSIYAAQALGVDAEKLRAFYVKGFLEDEELSEMFFSLDSIEDEHYFYYRLFEKFSKEPIDDEKLNATVSWFINVPFISNQAAVSALKQVAIKYRVGVFSNGTPSRAKEIADMGLTEIEHVVVSYKTGAEKPNLEAYKSAADIAGITPANIGLIDDSVENLAGAAKAGFCFTEEPSAELWASFS